MQMAAITVREKKVPAKNIKLKEQREKTRFWKNVQKQENDCWVWTGTKKENGWCFFYRSIFENKNLPKNRHVKTPPQIYAKKLRDGMIEKSKLHGTKIQNFYFLKTGEQIINSVQKCKTQYCCNPEHWFFQTINTKDNVLVASENKIEFSNNAEQQKIERIKRLKEAGSRSISVIEYDIQCLKAKANRINLNGEYFYPESLQALYQEAIDELKLWLDHANSMFRYHDDREEIYHKLHQAIIDGLRQFDSGWKEMEDRDAR